MIRKVALVGVYPTGYSRSILGGFLAFSDARPHWQLLHEPLASVERVEGMLEHFEPDAILCESNHPEVLERLIRWGGPLVVVARRLEPDVLQKVHSVRADNTQIGRLAFGYLRERGFQTFIYVGWDGHPVSEGRQRGFEQAAQEAGFAVSKLSLGKEGVSSALLSELLHADPRPAALFTANDDVGLGIIRAARQMGVDVPERLAVLGVDNHPILCRISHPLLSSIDPGTAQIGYRGGELLDALCSGERLPCGEERVSPVRVVTRTSTEILSTSDPNLMRAYAYIREHGCDDFRFEDLVRHSRMSRRSLETHYKAAFGSTLGEHLTRVRLKRACELLEHTDFYTADIAAECDWPSASHMSVMFKRHMRMTPTEYRRHVRKNGSGALP